MRRVTLVLTVVLAFSLHAQPAKKKSSPKAAPQPSISAEAAERKTAVESGLLMPVTFSGEPGMKLQDRMTHYGVPGMSITVWHDGKVDWSQSYGVVAKGSTKAVNSKTLFQAGSISKMLASVTTLKVLQRRGVLPDARLGSLLKSWRVPGGETITVAQVLSHTAGLNVPGFPGFRSGHIVPTLLDELEGKNGANTQALRVVEEPGRRFRFSGGGYLLIQQMLADIEGKPYADIVRNEVLIPANMPDSTFAHPLPDSLRSRASGGVSEDGTDVPIGGRIYPEHAAAGLWTTSNDLARFGMALQRRLVLPEPLATRMMTPMPGTGGRQGLGVSLQNRGRFFLQPGANTGYFALLAGINGETSGVAIMTNSENAEGLTWEILRAIARVYNWDGYLQPDRKLATVDAKYMATLEGTYLVDADDLLSVRVDGNHLVVSHTLGGEFHLYPVSNYDFINPEDGTTYTFGGNTVTVDKVTARRSTTIVPSERLARGEGVADAIAALRKADPAVLEESRLRQRGEALIAKGKAAEAAALLELNAELNPKSSAAWDALMRAQAAAGDRQAAKRTARKVVDALTEDWDTSASWRMVYRDRAREMLR